MNEATISPDDVMNAAVCLYAAIEENDMRAAIATLAAMLIMPDLDWPPLCDDPAVKLTEAAIVGYGVR